jgi:hypothetical protein
MISAVVDTPSIQPMLDAMAKASAMSVTAGKAAPISVSLLGSSKVLNAFRTCAGIAGSAPGAGSNPFQ